eukprot:3557503-Amphidinium_carterae.1
MVMQSEKLVCRGGSHWSEIEWYDTANRYYQYFTAFFAQSHCALLLSSSAQTISGGKKIVLNLCQRFHWATVQWTGAGSNELTPTNSLERIFTSVVLLVGLFFGSVLISWVSALVFEQQQQSQARREKLLVLQRFLIQNKVDSNLAVRVQRQ